MWQKEQATEEFQRGRRRATQQRRILLEVIPESDWTNYKGIYYEACKRGPNLGMATMHETVSILEGVGVLVRTYQYSSSDSSEEEEDCQQQSFASY